MLAELEDGLVALLKSSALAGRLRCVAGLPDGGAEQLLQRLAAEAPGVYVAPLDFTVADGQAAPRFEITCVARNARGQEAARKGDGKLIGLTQMVDAVLSLMDGGVADGVVFYVAGAAFPRDAALADAGLYVATVSIQASGVLLPSAIDETTLADFKTFRAAYDIEPFETSAEHVKWAGDPPDHATTAPEVSETVTLQP